MLFWKQRDSGAKHHLGYDQTKYVVEQARRRLNFLHHLLPPGGDSGGSSLARRRHQIDDETLSHVTPLVRRHINPFGRYHFDLNRMRQDKDRDSNHTP